MSEPALQDKERAAPQFKIYVGGSELPVEKAVDVLEVTFSDYIEGASTFTITFNNWDSDRQDFKWVDVADFGEGVEIEVKLGYVDLLSSMVKGEVTAIEPEFHDHEAPTLRIHGYDLLHRFRRGRKTRSFVKMKDSAIVEQIAGELNLRAQADDTQVEHEYVLQSNLSDIDFILERARRINYEVTVKDKTLIFRKSATDKDKVVTLDYGLTLKTFYPRLNTLRQVSEVVVQGWNALTKEAITGTARKGDETATNGQKLGVSISEQAFSATKAILVDKPIFSAGEANQIARGKFNEMADDYITGEGTAIGNKDIRAGVIIELNGLGERFGGRYYVTSSTHLVGQIGYLTKFTVSRNAA